MIQTDAEYEAALEHALRLFDPPPAEGSADEAELFQLLEAIEAYQPAVDVEDTAKTNPGDALVARANAVKARYEQRRGQETFGGLAPHRPAN